VKLLPGGKVQVSWGTLSETQTYQFYLQKQDPQWHAIDSVKGAGASVSPRTYVLSDPDILTGPSTYRIMAVDVDRTFQFSASVTLSTTGVREAVARSYALGQNYPNPFNPTTTIRFQIPERAYVRMELFNQLGQHMSTLRSGEYEAGVYDVVVDARPLPSGVYYYTLAAGTFAETKRFVLIR
jgi:hypothetical protein